MAGAQLGPRPRGERVVGTGGGRRVDRAPLPAGVGRARLHAPGAGHRVPRVPRLRRGAAPQRSRDDDGRAHDPHPRDARADRAARDARVQREPGVVPAVQRAGLRVRSRRPHDPCHPRRGPLGDLRAEGLELTGDGSRLRHAHGPHRLRRAEARGHLVVRVPARPARGDDPAAAGDDRTRAVQRGLLRRRHRRRRRPHRGCEQRLGRRQHHAALRAHRHRRGRRRWRLPASGHQGRLPRHARRRRGAGLAARGRSGPGGRRSSSTSPGGTTAPTTHTCARSSRR